MRASILATLLAAIALGLAACGGGDDAGQATSEPASQATEIGCRKASEPAPRGDQDVPRPRRALPRGAAHVAVVATSCGDFEVTLDVERAPKTTASFVHLAERRFYDGLTFHRISPGFVIQGGDPRGDGTGGPGYKVREAPPDSLSYEKGVVAMAKGGDEPPGTSGSQFFVMTESSDLPPEYALLGEVTKGLEVVEKIGVSATDDFEKPREPVVIERITIRKG